MEQAQEILSELRRLRQDLEVGAAINLVEGINTVETLAVLGHWIQRQRPPTAAETVELERLARQRWAAQVRQTLALVQADATQLDERMAALAGMLAGARGEAKGTARGTAKARGKAARRPVRRPRRR